MIILVHVLCFGFCRIAVLHLGNAINNVARFFGVSFYGFVTIYLYPYMYIVQWLCLYGVDMIQLSYIAVFVFVVFLSQSWIFGSFLNGAHWSLGFWYAVSECATSSSINGKKKSSPSIVYNWLGYNSLDDPTGPFQSTNSSYPIEPPKTNYSSLTNIVRLDELIFLNFQTEILAKNKVESLYLKYV